MTIIAIDRIETYLEEKSRIIDAMEKKLLPFFTGLMAELEEAARALVGPQVSEEWCSRMMEVLHALGPNASLFRYDRSALAGLQDILDAYAADTGIRLSRTYEHESGMDEDEVNFSFECDPWRLLFSKELSSAHDLHTGAFIWVAQLNDDNAGVYLNGLRDFELADLRVIRATFDTYWDGALLWGKMRRSHLE